MSAVIDTRPVRLVDLQPLEGNPRRGDIDLVMRSIKAHGQFRAILVRAENMMTLAGNHTMMAMERLALANDPVVERDDEGEPLILAHLIECDDVEARRIALVDNRANELGTFDDAALADMLRDLAAQGVDLTDDGYDEGALLELLSDGDDNGDASPQLGDVEYRILIRCEDEHHQAALISELEERGLRCQPLAQ